MRPVKLSQPPTVVVSVSVTVYTVLVDVALHSFLEGSNGPQLHADEVLLEVLEDFCPFHLEDAEDELVLVVAGHSQSDVVVVVVVSGSHVVHSAATDEAAPKATTAVVGNFMLRRIYN